MNNLQVVVGALIFANATQHTDVYPGPRKHLTWRALQQQSKPENR